jgi:hypothetical protein
MLGPSRSLNNGAEHSYGEGEAPVRGKGPRGQIR